jgi:chromosome segregation ATPase
MDSANFIKSDSANLLLNEIDILLAQLRLLELYVKQSQATAARETARIHEQYQAELNRLRSRPALGDNEQSSFARLTTVGMAEQNRRDSALQNALSEKQRLLESRDIELKNAISETAILRGRIAELELARHQAQAVEQEFAINRQDLQVEVAALRHQLETKQADFEQQQLVSRALQQGLEEQLAQLGNQLTERQATLQGVATELRQARIEIAALQAQIAELQTSRHEAQAMAAHELEQTRGRFEAEIAGLQNSLAERDRALEEDKAAIAEIERSLKTEILALRSQLEQKQELVEFRDDELRDAHRHLAALQQRVTELESANQLAATNGAEVERIRSSFESEVTALQREVATRTRALNELREAVTATELALRGEIQTLQQEQARSRGMIEERENELHSSRAEVAGLRERIGQLEAAAAADLATRQLGEETRRSLEAELTSLHSTLAQQEYALKEQQNFFQSVEERLGGEITQLRSELTEHRTAADANNAELERLRSELQERNAQVELARRQLDEDRQHAGAQRQELESRLQSKEHELRVAEANAQEQKETALREQESQFRSAEAQLRTESDQLRTQLEEQLRLSDQGNAELERLRSEIAARHEQSTQSELSRRQLEENWQQAEAQRQELEARIQAKDHELRVAEANVQEQKEAALREEENQYRSAEEQLSGVINQLRSELAQQQTASESRNAELEGLRSEMTLLQEQSTQSELSRRQLEENWQHAEAQRQELEARIQARDHELGVTEANAEEQKEAALREQENQFRSAEERLSGVINQLRSELAQQQTVSESNNAEIERLRSEITALQEQGTQSELSRRQLDEDRQHAGAQRQELESRLQAKEHELRGAEANAQQQKETALREQEILFRAVEERLAAEVKQLRTQLEEQYGLSGQGNAELERLRSEIAEFQNRNEQSERSRRELEENWRRAAASEQELRTSLLAKEDELRAAQTKGDELKDQFETAISQLQLQLTETGLLAASRVTEIGNLQAEINRLSEQFAHRESAERERQANFQKEIELNRSSHEAEMAAAYQQNNSKQAELETELAQERQTTAGLRDQMAERERLLDEAQATLKTREQDFAAAAAEAATLQARLHELEAASQAEASRRTESDQALTRLETELISTRTDLQQKNWALAQQQATMENLAQVHRQQIQNLEAKLAEQQHSIKDRNLDLERAQSQSHALERRIEDLETHLQHAQLTVFSRVEQTTQNYAAQIEDLKSQLAQKTHVLQERDLAASNIEHTLRSELDRLVRESEERNQILQNRNDELVLVKAEMDSLQERFMQLESSTSQAESAWAGQTERLHTDFQARLALLQAELSQKEWALEERNAAASAVEQQYRQEIEELRQKLAENEARAQTDRDEFVLGKDRMTEEQKERLDRYQEVIDKVTSGPNQSFPASEGRRWRTGFAWKRRWKS